MYTAAYVGEPDVVWQFPRDGDSYLFGRDDTRCQIVVWSALNDKRLSRVAGRIWRMDDQLWLANLSESHDLCVVSDGRPPEPFLPPKDPAHGRPPARSLPHGTSIVLGPAGCEIVVHQLWEVQDPATSPAEDDLTVRVPPVPDHLRDVAEALCRPLLQGSFLPASYGQVVEEVPGLTLKRARTLVAQLTALYAAELPALAQSVRARVQRQEQLLAARGGRHLVGGVWRFEPLTEDDAARRRNLMLPDYFEVAHLLVRRGLVGRS